MTFFQECEAIIIHLLSLLSQVFEELEQAWLAKLFFVMYMLFVLIVLMNLLIAIMGDTFDRVKGTENTQFLLGRAGVIDDIESMLSDSQINEIE